MSQDQQVEELPQGNENNSDNNANNKNKTKKTIAGLLLSLSLIGGGGYLVVTNFEGAMNNITDSPEAYPSVAPPEKEYNENSPEDYKGVSAKNLLEDAKKQHEKDNKEAEANDRNSAPNGYADDKVINSEFLKTNTLSGWDENWFPLSDKPHRFPESFQKAWACDESDGSGAVGWQTARRIEGPAVFVPSVCAAVPLITTGTQEETDKNGTKYDSLELPDAPLGTVSKNHAPIGAKEGNTIIASHVNYNSGKWAPFHKLREMEKGAPIIVRDKDGNLHTYKMVSNEIPTRTGMLEKPEVFSMKGKPKLRLITCSGSTLDNANGERLFVYNLIVTAEPVE